MDYSQILVYILAIAFGFLLVASLAVMTILYKILQNVRHVTEKAESMAESFVAVGEAIKKTAIPTAVSGAVANAIGNFVKAKSDSKKEKK